jgi:hypothetical protein
MDQWQNKGGVQEPTGNKDSAKEKMRQTFVECRRKISQNLIKPLQYVFKVTDAKIAITIIYQRTFLEIQKPLVLVW